MEKPVELGIIQQCIESVMGLGENSLLVKTRVKDYCTARVLFCDIALKSKHTLATLVKFFNQWNRAAVTHMIKCVKNWSEYNEDYRQNKSKVIELLNKSISSQFNPNSDSWQLEKILNNAKMSIKRS